MHAHHHHHDSDGSFPTSPLVRYVTLGLLILVAAATVVGLAVLWPDYGKVTETAETTELTVPGTVYAQGEILGLSEGCGEDEAVEAARVCLLADVGLRSGPDAGNVVEIPLTGGLVESGLRVGDHVELSGYPSTVQPGDVEGTDAGTGDGDAGGDVAGSDGAENGIADDGQDAGGTDATSDASAMTYEIDRSYTVTGIQRHLPLIVLALVFMAVVVAVGRVRGLLALIALGVSVGVLLAFVLPALVAGGPGLLIGIVGSSAIMFATLYFVHGPNMRTTAALIGTLCGILIIAGGSFVSVHVARLSGIGDEASGFLSSMVSEIDFRGLLTCSILIAGLGVLNDVTITQASSVWELRAAAPEMSRREIYTRAMRIGRDHIASTVYTVFFAYVGAAISVLILLYLYDRPVLSLLASEDIAIEVVSTLCGSIGLVLAAPITTWIATLFVPPGREEVFEGWDASPGDREASPRDAAPALSADRQPGGS